MRYRLHVEPFQKTPEGSGFLSDVLKKGVSQGSKWLKGVLEREGPGAIQRLSEMITKPVISTGSNILDKIIKWSGGGLRVAGRYGGKGYSVAGRGSRSRSRSRSKSRSKSPRKSRKGSGTKRKSRSRSRSRSSSRSSRRSSRSRSRSVGSGKKSPKRRKSPKRGKKKRSSSKGRGMTYKQLKPLLNRPF